MIYGMPKINPTKFNEILGLNADKTIQAKQDACIKND